MQLPGVCALAGSSQHRGSICALLPCLRYLSALEMNVLLNLTPLMTAFWAWFLLAERLTWIEGAGMLVAVIGIGLVQQRRK